MLRYPSQIKQFAVYNTSLFTTIVFYSLFPLLHYDIFPPTSPSIVLDIKAE